MSDEIKSTKDSEVPAVKRPRGRPRKVQEHVSSPQNEEVKAKRTRKLVPKVEVVAATSGVITPLKYIFTVGRRKRATARVFVYHDGKGTIEVNGKPVERYFPTSLLTEVVGQALSQSPFKSSTRIVAQVRGGGMQGQAEAVRLGIARALLKIDETLRPTMRARGYLTRDPREKERKKPGLKRARRAPQWQKR